MPSTDRNQKSFMFGHKFTKSTPPTRERNRRGGKKRQTTCKSEKNKQAGNATVTDNGEAEGKGYAGGARLRGGDFAYTAGTPGSEK